MRSTSGFRMYLATPTTYTGLSVAGRKPVIYTRGLRPLTHASQLSAFGKRYLTNSV